MTPQQQMEQIKILFSHESDEVWVNALWLFKRINQLESTLKSIKQFASPEIKKLIIEPALELGPL